MLEGIGHSTAHNIGMDKGITKGVTKERPNSLQVIGKFLQNQVKVLKYVVYNENRLSH